MLEVRSSQGFTVLELLVVFVIVSILTILALPNLLNFNADHRTTLTAQSLYYTLQYARSEAIENNQTAYVNFQTGATWCYGVNLNANCNCSVSGSCGLQVVTVPASRSTTLSATGLGSGNSLTFEPTHGASGAKSIVTFTDVGGVYAMSVEVPIMGSALLCSTTISGYSACP